MLAADQIEDLICLVASLDRPSLIRQIQVYRASFPLDFSDEFLNTVPLDRLRHIFVALCLQQQHVPELPTSTAA
jgi:hypothetical protein